jgi:hypothetical protein
MDKVGFLEEAPGVKSASRLTTVFGHIGVVSLMALQAATGHLDSSVLITYIGAVCLQHVGNKFAENLGQGNAPASS